MAYPYYYLPFAPIDPFTMMYTWTYLWFYWISMMYYIELFKVTIDAWRRFMETMFKAPQGTS
ncbi:MAG: hypothetical protein DRJ66_07495 [Thermoprotei archaeon]|nr:MAG: hypothetical protein DRJ66_07495 [Thermoprotei archaeon]RLF20544.1 MAG: hypothetical protein DRZ82_02010 [Thermoprotei archaeon]